MNDRPIVWSYGGGTQTVAIAVLVARGDLPKPECVVISDTDREATETWEYTDNYVKPMLSEVGVEIEVASHDLSTVDLYGHNGDMLMPLYTSKGKLPTFCSTEWKQRVIRRYLRSKGYGPENPAMQWMGMSVDEIGRCKPSGVQWLKNAWPLVFDAPHRRAQCRQLVLDAGLPEPPKSSCWMCPHRKNSQWRRLRDEYPEDFEKAKQLEAQMREQDSDVYVHESRVPLSEANLEAPDRAQDPLFGDLEDCESGHCMV